MRQSLERCPEAVMHEEQYHSEERQQKGSSVPSE